MFKKGRIKTTLGGFATLLSAAVSIMGTHTVDAGSLTSIIAGIGLIIARDPVSGSDQASGASSPALSDSYVSKPSGVTTNAQ